MKLTLKEIDRNPIDKCSGGALEPISKKENFNIIKIELDDNELSIIYDKAKRLAENVNEKNPSGVKRTKERKLLSSFCGVIAEDVVKQLIMKKLALIEDYIEITGTNVSSENFNYESHNDIEIHLPNNEIITVEVRSSIATKENLKEILNKDFDILGSYTTSYKSKELIKHYYLRVIFHNPRDYEYNPRMRKSIYNKKLENTFREEKDKILDYFKNNVKVYFVGGCTLEDLEKHGGFDSLKQKNAEYRIIRPITRGRDALEILEIFEKDVFCKIFY